MACLCVLAMSGCCTVTNNAFRTMIWEPIQFSRGKDIVRSDKKHRELAEAAWKRSAARLPKRLRNDDYESGFRDGYVDFLSRGGSGVPPVLPPRRYWRSKNRSEFRRGAEDWFSGFTHGASAARSTGRRESEKLTVVGPMRRETEVTFDRRAPRPAGPPRHSGWSKPPESDVPPPPPPAPKPRSEQPPDPFALPILVPNTASLEGADDDG